MPPTFEPTPDYHLGILKGYLLAQDAPTEVFDAAEALHMAAVEDSSLDAGRITISGPAKIELPKFEESSPQMPKPASGDYPQEAEPATSDSPHPVAETAVPKMRKPWSPEAREAAAERMKSMRARGVIKGRGRDEVQAAGKPFIEVPVDKLQTVHDGYAGRRDPGQELAETDWPDIRNMLEKQRRSVGQIASDYDVKYAVMQQFINRHSWKGNPAPGEANAPSR